MNESMLCTKTHEYVLEQGDTYEVGIQIMQSNNWVTLFS